MNKRRYAPVVCEVDRKLNDIEERVDEIYFDGGLSDCDYCIYEALDEDCTGVPCREGIKKYLEWEVGNNDKL